MFDDDEQSVIMKRFAEERRDDTFLKIRFQEEITKKHMEPLNEDREMDINDRGHELS